MSDDNDEIVVKRVCRRCRTGYMTEIPHYTSSTWVCEYCKSVKTYVSHNVPKGWSCPNCNRVYSPSITQCGHCNKEITEH